MAESWIVKRMRQIKKESASWPRWIMEVFFR